jgi:enoyl-CoA hydratase/carnithine racemase
VADCSVAVFAALEGDAIGVGLELALACKGRVAKDASTFALPAVLSGGLPIFGGVERLQALVDSETAAQLIVFGETIDAGTALRAGLIDGMVARGVVRLAVALSQSPDRGSGSLTPRLHSISAELPSIRYQIASRLRGQAAPLAAVQAMEAVLRLPPRRAALEIREIAARLSNTDEARALEHASRSKRLLQRLGTVQSAPLTELAAQLAWPMRREAIHLLDEGGSPAQVDRCLKTYGFVQLPFEEADRLGLAKVFSTNGRDIAGDDAWVKYSPTLDFMIDAGRRGGSQPGWFRRKGDDALTFDSEVEKILAASALFQRLQRARKPDEVFEGRLFCEMIVGSIELMAAHPALSWVDVDALWTARLGFPRWRGGPLLQGARSGWGRVRSLLEAQGQRRTTEHVSIILRQWEYGEDAPGPIVVKPEALGGAPFRVPRTVSQ